MKNFNPTASETQSVLEQIQANAQYHFNNLDLLDEALTHSSYASEQPNCHYDNQRLEFLGDAVLQIIISDYIFKALPEEQEGFLTRLRSFLANEQATAKYTLKLGLDVALKLGHGESVSGGRQRPSILGDLFEAFLGAVYLDSSIEAARELVLKILPPLEFCRKRLEFDGNPKGALQQWALKYRHASVSYKIISVTGPVHDPVYTVEAILCGEVIGTATGQSHKAAEKNAARLAIANLIPSDVPPDIVEPEPQETKPVVKKKPTEQKLLLALDFDGVLCDSVNETAASAWRTAHKIWPEQFNAQGIPPEISAAFRRIRPFLETGYQAVPMLKMLLDGKSEDYFVNALSTKINELLAAENVDTVFLKELFGETRDEWIRNDIKGWLSLHGFYPRTIDALRKAMELHQVLILTTKQERFVKALLKNEGLDFPEAQIFGLDRKMSKDTVLANVVGSRKNSVHFVEDRLETLRRIKTNILLTRVKLHYANWGYGTEADDASAKIDKRIQYLDLNKFVMLLTNN